MKEEACKFSGVRKEVQTTTRRPDAHPKVPFLRVLRHVSNTCLANVHRNCEITPRSAKLCTLSWGRAHTTCRKCWRSNSSPTARLALPLSPGHVIIVVLVFVAQASTSSQTAVVPVLAATSTLGVTVSVHGLASLLFLQHPLSVASFAFQRVGIFRGVARSRLSFRSIPSLLVGFVAMAFFGPAGMTTRSITIVHRLGSITSRPLAMLVTVPFTIFTAMSLTISVAVSIAIAIRITITTSLAVAVSFTSTFPVLFSTAGRILARPMTAANPACKVAFDGTSVSRNSGLALTTAYAASSVTA
jgi:hypothetical protein